MRYTDPMPIAPSAARCLLDSLTLAPHEGITSLFDGDPWLRLFANREVGAATLAHFLASGLVDPFHRDGEGRTLLHALLCRWAHESGDARIPSWRNGGQTIPLRPEGPWEPVANLDTSVVAGVLLGHGHDPFDRPSGLQTQPGNAIPDALAVALEQGWDEVVLHCLRAPSRPPTAALNARASSYLLTKDRQRLPWPHVLAHVDRLEVLQAWLGLPDMDPDLRDHHGRTPLFYATSSRVVSALLAAGARADATAKDGRTAVETWANPPEGALLGFASAPMRESMKALLAQETKTAASAGFEAWIQCENPHALLADARSQPNAFAAARIPRSVGGVVVEWGFVGFLAWSWLSLRTTKHSPVVPPAFAVMKALAECLPRSAWVHESLPGVADVDLMALASASLRSSFEAARIEAFKVLDGLSTQTRSISGRARMAVLPHLRGFARIHEAQEASRLIRNSLMDEKNFDADGYSVGADACSNRWLREEMGVLGLDLLKSSRASELLAHPRAADWVLCIVNHLPKGLPARLALSGDSREREARLEAWTTRVQAVLDTAAQHPSPEMFKAVRASARALAAAGVESVASKMSQWLLKHAIAESNSVEVQPEGGLREPRRPRL